MPLPSFYNQMPYLTDNHYGKEQFTNKYFVYKTKAVYPIFAFVGAAMTIAVASCVKNLTGNPNVTLAHSHLGAWNTKSLNALDVAHNARPAAETVLPPAEQ